MKEKICIDCLELYPARGTNSKYCLKCLDIITKIKQCERQQRYRIKNGLIKKSGVGSGGNQLGSDNHRYKTGIYSNFVSEGKKMKEEIGSCERCGKSLKDSTPSEWCCHHKDHDRTHNERSNYELLCKRCHQLEHNCESNLPN